MADMNATARFAINTYTLVYDGNTNNGVRRRWIRTVHSDHGSTVTVLSEGDLTKTGYTFSGWNTQAGGGGSGYNENDTFTITANVTL